MQNRWGQVTEEDYKIIANQLGREPRGVLGVALRCEYGYPQVIVNRPIIGQMEEVTVFPTSLWLTCPYLCKLISKLESIGLIGTLQMRIANDQELAELVKRITKPMPSSEPAWFLMRCCSHCPGNTPMNTK